MLGADTLVTPVSSNTAVALMPEFICVLRTRIGSPYVIAAMETSLNENAAIKIAGYEANGGFLLGFAAQGPAGMLSPLMTRDSLLPLVAPLAAARAAGRSVAQMVAGLPPRFTAADRVQGVPSERSAAFIAQLQDSAQARANFFEGVGSEAAIDLTDGLRVTFEGGAIVHLRPSGNAPECRCYAEDTSPQGALALVTAHLAKLKAELG
jgi:phosphomannomutase